MIYRDIRDDGVGRCIGWYAVSFTSLLLEWWLIKENLGIEYTNTIGTLLKGIGDVALILLPYWLLKPKWRWTAMLPLCLMAIWGIVNLAYFRFWNDLIPPAAITMVENVDGNLMEYGASLLRWSDLAFLGVPCLAWVGLRMMRPSMSQQLRPGMKWMCVAGSLLAGVAGQMSYLKTTYGWRNAISPISISKGLSDHFIGVYNVQRQLYEYNGPVYYGLRSIYDALVLLADSKELTEGERVEITEFLKIYERKVNSDSISIDTQGMKGFCLDSLNMVYIIVESLNADMVGRKIEGVEIMPVLDSLTRKEGTVVFDNVVSQIKASSSSDGHLLLLTGLLPPQKAAYSITYGSHNKFPSLADIFPEHNKYLLLADDGLCWNEGNTLHNFGLGEPLSIKDRPEYPIEEYGRDGAMFKQAIEMMKGIKEPFLITLMTISMHIPFREKAWPLPDDLRNAAGLTQMEKEYANMCRNTDQWIGEFLKTLPDNTLIIIASDHHQEVASEETEGTRAFFMAVNSRRTERISRTVGQVNLFPATLDILGVKNGYGGLAPSAFVESVDGTMDSYGNICGKPSREALDTLGRAYGISDLIIRGDYFK
ncbi:MAG: sulfatase-like hydrolase/transferase [Muribaculaceae bacterium]|nr:sulfatase-like hydrolase/transferase [Muribaculaceae bacterium]